MEVISLAAGSSYFRSPEAATQAAVKALHEGKTFYGPSQGTPELRKAISQKYKAEGISLEPSQVLITPGTKQALFNLFSVLLRQGDDVVVPTPAWFGFHELMKYSNGTLVPLPTKLEDGYKLTPDMLRVTLSERTRILLLTNPGNPTGRVYSKSELEALLEVTKDYPNLYVISDEIYDLVTYGSPVASILSCQGAKAARTIVVNGFSKSFAMSGWRLGFILGPDELIAKCVHFQNATVAGVSIFIQDAAQATVENRHEALPHMQEILAHNRSVMQQGLDAIPEVRYYLPDGAYYFFPDFSQYLNRTSITGEKISTSVDLCRYLRTCYNLELSPGDYFGAPGHARMSFAVETPRLQDALNRLRQGLLLLTAD
ncbi:pyridoxal phosphate-dependent aminotransferase [Pontibacter akesuensis]|uniref:Aminotransferase n=1 Tax=Pontibacter akesuensis TaxID=388950 RepID=A0A1I7FY43_9BACT|nr:aminotransferase class I/II-fold pyridoxal phosphate-dependent enzyme [Pontibacter akesuensis]GHA59923.1 aminotransferase [Pontibacter akesuensis]SFU41085.1 aspartate aminotransferase [Pontibacter akesuensis]